MSTNPNETQGPRTFEGPRGLLGYVTLDTQDGENIQLQASSAIMAGELEGPFFWLRINGTDAHLHHTDARAIRDALNLALGDTK